MAQGPKNEPKVVPLSGAILAVVLAALAGFIVGKVFAGAPAKRQRGSGSGRIAATKVDASSWEKMISAGTPMTVGPESAKVTVVVFSDYMCPYCKKVGEAMSAAARRFGNKLRIVYREFPLPMHDGADKVSEAALAAGAQGKYAEYHDALFEHQGSFSRGDLEEYAQDLGLDMAAFKQALDQRTFQAAVQADIEVGRAAGVTGTPTIAINGQMVVGPSSDKIPEMIQRALDGKPVADAPATGAPEGNRGAGNRGEGERRQAQNTPPPLPSETKDVKVESWNPSRGSASAPITMVVFCEYLCPFCKRIQPTIQALQAAYGDRIRFVFRNLIIHGEVAETPALAALAAAKQGKFDALHNLMFENQQQLRERANIERLAEQAGLDMARFRADMDSPEVRQQLEADKAEGERVGARGTPSSFINGRFLSGARPPSHFGAWIDKLLNLATPTIPASADPQQAAPTQGCGT